MLDANSYYKFSITRKLFMKYCCFAKVAKYLKLLRRICKEHYFELN